MHQSSSFLNFPTCNAGMHEFYLLQRKATAINHHSSRENNQLSFKANTRSLTFRQQSSADLLTSLFTIGQPLMFTAERSPLT